MNQIGTGQNHRNRMAQTADIGSKRLISLTPDDWLPWMFGLPEITSLITDIENYSRSQN